MVLRPCEAGESAEAWEIALVAADLLAADGIRAAVISAPSFELCSVLGTIPERPFWVPLRALA